MRAAADRVDLCHELLSLPFSQLFVWRFPVACRVQHRQQFDDDVAERTRRQTASNATLSHLSLKVLLIWIHATVCSQSVSQSINQSINKSIQIRRHKGFDV